MNPHFFMTRGTTHGAENRILHLMQTLLLVIIIALFIAMVLVNVLFRARVLKSYGKCIRAHIEFGAAHVFNKKKREEEIHTRYPDHIADIEEFCTNLQATIRMATVLIVLITLFGGVLMYFRHQ
jgi:flagellar basal body-associated protein FliL